MNDPSGDRSRPTGQPAHAAADPDRLAWEGSAAKWIEQGDAIAAMTTEATDRLIGILEPIPGERVLDVASGVGDPAFALAERVGARGQVLASDAVAAMADTLRARVAERGLGDRIEVLHGPVQELELPPRSFDAACSRFGVMFFPDPVEACRRLAAAVRSGGRLALMAWGPKEHNPYFTLAMSALDAAGAPEAQTVPGSRGVFECGDAGQLEGLGRAAGWSEVRELTVSFRMWLDTAPDGLLETQARLSDKVRERLDGLEPGAAARAAAEVAARAAAWAEGDRVGIPAVARVLHGRP